MCSDIEKMPYGALNHLNGGSQGLALLIQGALVMVIIALQGIKNCKYFSFTCSKVSNFLGWGRRLVVFAYDIATYLLKWKRSTHMQTSSYFFFGLMIASVVKCIGLIM